MKLKQSAIKLDNRKSNQALKQLKNEIDKKQTYLTEISKNIAASNEQFSKFRELIQLCSDSYGQQLQPQQAIYMGSVSAAPSAADENFNGGQQQYQVQESQLVQTSLSASNSTAGTPGTVYFINQNGNQSGSVVSGGGNVQQQVSSQQQMQYQQVQQLNNPNNVSLDDCF